LSTHRFRLYVLNDYLKVFFSVPLRLYRTTEDFRKRIASCTDPNGCLRVWVTKDALINTVIRPLLKDLIRIPGFTFSLASLHPDIVTPETVASLSALINNANSTWKKMIRQNSVSMAPQFTRYM
jgi:hypothetical protein